MQRSERSLKTPISRPSTGKLGTPGRLGSHKHSTDEDLHVNVKQLVAPSVETYRERKVFVNECDKPDVHLRSDQLKPSMEMLRIQSAARLKAEKTSSLNIDDELHQHIEPFQFEEMVRIGRPDRDNTLRVPLMRNLQTLRKYKMGTAPFTKTGILQNTLEEVVQDPVAKQLVANMSTRGQLSSSFDGTGAATLSATRATMSTPQLSPSKPHSASNSNNRTHTPSGARDKIVVRAASQTGMKAFHLSREGQRSVNKSQSEKTLPRFDLQADSIDSVVLAMPPESFNTEEVVEEPVGAMYDPATVRLPRMESVPGFGNTNPILDRALGAYRVHSNRAVTAAAALEEASLTEEMDSHVGRDSFHPDRVESFYKSAETSHMNSQEGHHRREERRLNGADEEESIDSNDVSVREISVKTAPEEVPLRRGLHCTKCFRAAGLWCPRCTAAYCSVCWGQVAHHDLRQMTLPSPTRLNQTRAISSQPPSPLLQAYQQRQLALQQQRGGTSPIEEAQSRSRSPSPSAKHSYAKSVMFQNYHSNRPASSGPDAKCRQTAAAKIPLPDQVVIQYDEYPAPPVFLDGHGRVVEDTIHRRPVTSPVMTQEELHRLQMSNHFKKQTAQEQYQQMLALKYKSHTIGAPAPISSGHRKTPSRGASPDRSASQAGTRNDSAGADHRESFGVANGIVYAQPKPKPIPHSKGRVVVRKNRKKDAKLRPSSPSFGLNPNGTLSLGYGGKPRANAKQLVNISFDVTKNISPDDWKSQLFAGNDVPSAHSDGKKVTGAKEISSPFYKVKPL